ncbi:MAG: hypothetical protein K4H23_04440 [Mollicutes bacterium PWAP]|nr:hypothetical protein [Mollicutes bacterium PWAP]
MHWLIISTFVGGMFFIFMIFMILFYFLYKTKNKKNIENGKNIYLYDVYTGKLDVVFPLKDVKKKSNILIEEIYKNFNTYIKKVKNLSKKLKNSSSTSITYSKARKFKHTIEKFSTRIIDNEDTNFVTLEVSYNTKHIINQKKMNYNIVKNINKNNIQKSSLIFSVLLDVNNPNSYYQTLKILVSLFGNKNKIYYFNDVLTFLIEDNLSDKKILEIKELAFNLGVGHLTISIAIYDPISLLKDFDNKNLLIDYYIFRGIDSKDLFYDEKSNEFNYLKDDKRKIFFIKNLYLITEKIKNHEFDFFEKSLRSWKTGRKLTNTKILWAKLLSVDSLSILKFFENPSFLRRFESATAEAAFNTKDNCVQFVPLDWLKEKVEKDKFQSSSEMVYAVDISKQGEIFDLKQIIKKLRNKNINVHIYPKIVYLNNNIVEDLSRFSSRFIFVSRKVLINNLYKNSMLDVLWGNAVANNIKSKMIYSDPGDIHITEETAENIGLNSIY